MRLAIHCLIAAVDFCTRANECFTKAMRVFGTAMEFRRHSSSARGPHQAFNELQTDYDWLYQTWLPNSGEEPRGGRLKLQFGA